MLSEQSLVGIGIIQGNSIVYANQALCEITGIDQIEIRTTKVSQLLQEVHPDDRDHVTNQMRRKLSGDKQVIIHYSYRIRRRDGQHRWVDQYSKAIRFAGEVAIFLTLVDITERKEAEQALVASRKRIENLHHTARAMGNCSSEDEVYGLTVDAAEKILAIRL